MLKKYNALFIFPGTTKDEALDQTVEKTTAEITRLGGTVENTETMGRRNFARQMQKRDHGIYVKVRFQLAAGSIAELKARYRLNEDIFRVQILARDERYDSKLEADKVRRAVHRAKVEAAKAEAEQQVAAKQAAAGGEDSAAE